MASKDKTPKTPKTDFVTHDDEMVSFVPGSSVIDIGELRRAQANQDSNPESMDESSDEDADSSEDDLSLDEEAELIRQELASDPEMKKDVLEGFDRSESNDNLERIAGSVHQQELENLREMEILASETSDELRALNEVFIAEDKLLEGKMAQETMAEAAQMAGSRGKKSAAKNFTHQDAPDQNLKDSELSADDEEDVLIEEMSEEDQALRSALPQADENGEYPLDDLQSCIEALLFYSDRSVSLKKLKDMLEMTEADDAPILQAIEQLKAAYQTSAHGFEVAEIAGGYQLRTKASKAPLLRKLAKVQVQRLSRGAMETLTIVSYKQPCTKDDIDQVRGVDSSHFIRTLLDRKLIEVSGRSEAAGRPMIYATTDTFLEVFGLMDLKGLPPLHEIEAMVPQMAAAAEGEEDPRVIQMRKMVHQMKIEANHLDYNAKEDEVILQEIRDRVKAIDITTPYLARQKEMAEQGIVGEAAEMLLAKEFGFDRKAQAEPAAETQSELSLDASEIAKHIDGENSSDDEILDSN
jgi:segregation and condensation protein B